MIFAQNNLEGRFKDRLANPDYYVRAIVRLHRKYHSGNTGKIYLPSPEGYNLMQAFMDRKRLAAALAADISQGAYVFSPAHINSIITPEKVRKVFSFSLTDQIVNTAIYLMLAPEMLPYISSHVHSYVRGRSRTTAVQHFMQHLKEHRRTHPDIKTRGLFVLRSDIKSYGESVPVRPGAPLWHMIDDWFITQFGAVPNESERHILTRCIRPLIEDKLGHCHEKLEGIPDGAPISALLLNLYAKPLDIALSSVPGGFYLRFGDDFLFAHPDHEPFMRAEVVMRGVLKNLGLHCNEKKTHQVFMNGAARGSHGLKGVSYVEYLGCQLCFNGTVGLKNEKIQALLTDLRQRAAATAGAVSGTADARGALVSAVIDQALQPHSVFAAPQATSLRHLVSDRCQLRALDKQVARIILQALTGNASIKQFRKIPYRKIRSQWKVRSLEYARN